MANRATDQVDSHEVPRRFPGHRFDQVTRYGGLVDGSPIYLRPGGLRSRGYLVNILVDGPLGRAIRRGRGFLCMNRGRCFLIPHENLREWLKPKFARVMIDIYLDLETETLLTAGLDRFPVGKFGGSRSYRSPR